MLENKKLILNIKIPTISISYPGNKFMKTKGIINDSKRLFVY